MHRWLSTLVTSVQPALRPRVFGSSDLLFIACAILGKAYCLLRVSPTIKGRFMPTTKANYGDSERGHVGRVRQRRQACSLVYR